MVRTKSSSIDLKPISIRDAKKFVTDHHRHNKAPVGAKFCIGVIESWEEWNPFMGRSVEHQNLVGVAMVGRPVSAQLQDGFTAEVLRVCTLEDSPKNCCSMLYSACWRAWKAMGGKRILTYTLKKEQGASVRGAGWQIVAECEPSNWNRPNSGRERDHQPIYQERKYRWEVKR